MACSVDDDIPEVRASGERGTREHSGQEERRRNKDASDRKRTNRSKAKERNQLTKQARLEKRKCAMLQEVVA